MAVKTREIEYQIDGAPFTGYYAYDDAADGPRPGVILVHEFWGHNDYVRGRAEQLAGDGFAALALDMYGKGNVTDEPGQATEWMNETVASGAIEARFDAAVDVIKQQSETDAGNISAAGYCFGGAVVLNMARAGKPLKVAASFHGLLQTENPLAAGAFAGQIAVFNGADDPMVTPDIVAAFEDEMRAAGANYLLKNYAGVVHGFTNPEATARGEKYQMPLAYDKQSDHDSYDNMLMLLRG